MARPEDLDLGTGEVDKIGYRRDVLRQGIEKPIAGVHSGRCDRRRVTFLSNATIHGRRRRFRALAYADDGTCTLISRKNNLYKSFAALSESLARLKTRFLNGEIVCLDAHGKSHFMPLLARKAQVSFYVIDLVACTN